MHEYIKGNRALHMSILMHSHPLEERRGWVVGGGGRRDSSICAALCCTHTQASTVRQGQNSRACDAWLGTSEVPYGLPGGEAASTMVLCFHTQTRRHMPAQRMDSIAATHCMLPDDGLTLESALHCLTRLAADLPCQGSYHPY